MELGSEFDLNLSELTVTKNNLFEYLSDYNCIYTDSGRSALKLVSKNLNEVLLPEFTCESVSDCFNKDKLKFYSIDEYCAIDLESLKNNITENTDCIFIMHYFGVLQNEETLSEIRRLADEHNIMIIEDTTHSIFSKTSTIGDYMIASIRKWMPISLGGVLYSKNKLPDVDGIKKSSDNDRLYGMTLKNLFLNDILDCNSTYRNIFSNSEKNLDNKEEVELMSDLNRFIISCFDINDLKSKRKSNYEYILEKMKDSGIKPIASVTNDECPFVFPIRVINRNDFRIYLMENNIYCAVHWPFDGLKKEERKMAEYNAETLISLPVDQRYDKEEMDYLIKVIQSYGGELIF